MDNLLPKIPRNKALFVCTVCLLSLIPIIKADPVLVYIECPNTNLSTTSTYAPNSTYQTNLNTLFSVLSANSNNASNGFYSFAAGSSPPDIAYGLFLCRGDVSITACRECVIFATKDVVERCPRSKRVTIWYDECMLRYSNVSISATLDTGFQGILYNPENFANGTRFREVLVEIMDDIRDRASSDHSGRKFATAEANYSLLQRVYGLAQCTPDISNSDCNTCLQNCISTFPTCCNTLQGARILFPSCYVSGYMSPEYALRGQFSIKSDVFSFGLLVLEIISGKKNYNFYQDGAAGLVSYAWKLWTRGTPLDLMDPTLEGSYARNKVTRCIHISLLCIQDDPGARPSMATVVQMLNGDSATLALPQKPVFVDWSSTGSNRIEEVESDQSTSNQTSEKTVDYKMLGWMTSPIVGNRISHLDA
ncbi:hypothetical protein RHSIM_Rhsim13G0160900 [Rhododendron simsii]|uniref:Gnk2-homologous domain-containing protein n=1 Tax=Rhododendron simsii TaxID=118357 RepID=A0A834G064_RHOSS|nr:hypothetical protein RHSIM_Rhsim13G0160900 [Rhododendron simsii]